MNGSEIEAALAALGATLEERGETASYLVIGGSSLILRDLVGRSTYDVDVVAEVAPSGYLPITELPAPVATAAAEVARALGLDARWLNVGPAGMTMLGLPRASSAGPRSVGSTAWRCTSPAGRT